MPDSTFVNIFSSRTGLELGCCGAKYKLTLLVGGLTLAGHPINSERYKPGQANTSSYFSQQLINN